MLREARHIVLGRGESARQRPYLGQNALDPFLRTLGEGFVHAGIEKRQLADERIFQAPVPREVPHVRLQRLQTSHEVIGSAGSHAPSLPEGGLRNA